MNNISAILLAIDGDYDDRAILEEVETLVQADHTSVTLLSIADSPPTGDPDKNPAEFNLYEWGSKIRSAYVDDLSASLSAKGLQVSVRYVVGTSYLEIIRETLERRYDLVVKPAKREAGLKQLLLGGTDVQLLSLCPVPVWIFRPTPNRVLKNIAVAVDLQPDSREKTALAGSVLQWGKGIADLVGAELHVVHVWSLYREAALRSRTDLSGTVEQLLVSKERVHQTWLDKTLRQGGIAKGKAHEHLIKGEAKQVIPDTMTELDIDLLVMGTVGRTGIPGFFIGNTADAVLRRVNCSVLAIKPDAFSTPVKVQEAR